MHLSVHGDRKVPKERHQRAGRPLDTRFSYMGLFDSGYTRRGIRKALRMSWRRRFSHTPPNSTQGGRGLSILSNHGFCRAGGGARYPLSTGRQPPLPCLRVRIQDKPLGEEFHFPAELGGQPHGRQSDGRAGIRVLATFRAIRLFRRTAKESRGSGGGFLKGGTVGDSLEWRSFGTFLST